ncbi:GNAT family N-acetyltransferase [Phormidesmis sp. 146-33]
MEIITKRFLLRDFSLEDEPNLLAYHADPQYAQFCAPTEVEPDYTRALLRLFIQWSEEQPRRNYQLAIASLKNRQELIGCCGLRQVGDDETKAELGIELAPQYWGRYRYAIEVASRLIEFGFCHLELQEIVGFSIDANVRVTRLARRYGFVAVKSHPGADWMHEKEWHQIEWQLLRKRWEDLSAEEMA